MNSPKKIFVDCRWYSQPGQGVVTYLDGLHAAADRWLQQAGLSGRFEFWYGIDDAKAVAAGLHLPADRVIEYGKRSMLWRLFAFPFYLKKHGFDLAHFTYVCPLFKLRTKYITSMHDVLFLRNPQFFSAGYRWTRKILYGLSARRSDILLTISQQSEHDIKHLLHRKKATHVIPCGAAEAVVSQQSSRSPVQALVPRQFILTVGRIEPRKNYPRLADAFEAARLAGQGATLVIAGFCPKEFASELEKISNRPNILWLNRVSDEELNWLYANARGFVFPSHCEGFGIPVIEAIRAKLPIAVSTTYPLHDVVDMADQRFDPSDTASMAAALQALWCSTDGPRPKQILLERYNWPTAAKAYIEVLQRYECMGDGK